MESDRRDQPRLKPKGLKAGISIDRPSSQTQVFEGDIIDISYSGIRIRLKEPLKAKFNDIISISLTLPESGTPFTINGSLKPQHIDSECCLHYADNHPDASVDDLLFDCIKLSEETLLVKTT
jgi:hypothetical protein